MVLWDTAGGRYLTDKPLLVPEGCVSKTAFSPNGEVLAAGYNKERSGSGVVLWDVAGRRRLHDQPLPRAAPNFQPGVQP